jgi:pimeloyl-ACP methyl ester carboxylesterase
MYARVCDARSSMPVILVHGFGVSGAYFVPAAERLACEFCVYVPDLPAHGRSARRPEPLDVPALAAVLVAWMDALSIGRAALVGQSMGCQIAIEAAVRFSARVARLVLVGPTVDPAARSLGKLLWRLVRAGVRERPCLIPLVAYDYLRMAERIVPEYRAMLADRSEAKLARIGVPSMLVRGEHDAIAPERWVADMARLLNADRVAVIPGAAHAAQFSAPDAFVQAIAPFLRQTL